MTTNEKTNARLTRELLDMAKGVHTSGIMTDAAYEKITMRHFGGVATTAVTRNVKN
jgi:hypothetical protein